MRKLYIFGLIVLAAVIIGLAFADQMTFTTYYPAPYGVYNNMRVMNSLGVGTTEPQAKLDISGDGDTILVPRKSDSGDPVGINGMIYYNSTSGKFRCYEDGEWKDLTGGGDLSNLRTVAGSYNYKSVGVDRPYRVNTNFYIVGAYLAAGGTETHDDRDAVTYRTNYKIVNTATTHYVEFKVYYSGDVRNPQANYLIIGYRN